MQNPADKLALCSRLTLMAYGSPVLLPPLASLADCFSALRHSLRASLCSLSFANNLGVFPSLFFNVDGQPINKV